MAKPVVVNVEGILHCKYPNSEYTIRVPVWNSCLELYFLVKKPFILALRSDVAEESRNSTLQAVNTA